MAKMEKWGNRENRGKGKIENKENRDNGKWGIWRK